MCNRVVYASNCSVRYVLSIRPLIWGVFFRVTLERKGSRVDPSHGCVRRDFAAPDAGLTDAAPVASLALLFLRVSGSGALMRFAGSQRRIRYAGPGGGDARLGNEASAALLPETDPFWEEDSAAQLSVPPREGS